ncbi:MAG: DNA cytosine methyltransferase [Clostridium sp.]|nr:DNA cytosine methyltransferase [Clostridium sp.]
MKKDACDTLKTRAAFHYLKENCRLDIYRQYLIEKKEGTDGKWLWEHVPAGITGRVINQAIGEETIDNIFNRIESLKDGKDVDIIIGGPPCQAYSIVGRARMGEKVKDDHRNYLYKYYLQFIKRFQPQMFVFENVLGIKTAMGGGPFEDLCKLAGELGYTVEPREQIASNYGVLQNRHRMIIVGWKKFDGNKGNTSYSYPDIKTIDIHSYNIKNDLFSDLPSRKAGEGKLCEAVHYTRPLDEMGYMKESGIRGVLDFTTQHIARPNNHDDREIYMIAVQKWMKGERLNYATLPQRLQHHKNTKSFLNRFCVVNPNGFCHTIVAHLAMDGHYFIYPTENPTIENSRSITIREAARIQSFPDDYFFEGSRTSAFRQIGNAVPVMMAYCIAEAIKSQLE